MTVKLTREVIADVYPEALFADGFDSAIIGVACRCGQPAVVVYDRELCLAELTRQGMDRDEAEEYFEFNVTGAWVGPETPVFLYRMEGYVEDDCEMASCGMVRG